MRKYIMFGLGVHSDIPLWGEGVADCARDVSIVWDQTANVSQSELAERDATSSALGEIRLAWPSIEICIRDGTTIVVRAAADSEVTHLRHLVSGIGVGLALYQRGFLTLHAGAVAIGNQAIAIAGAKGAGKSTLVAALTARGHGLVSDDVVVVDLAANAVPRVRAGAPNINLWPDSATATGYDRSSFSPIISLSPKLAGLARTSQPSVPVPMAAIVVLDRGANALRCEQLAPVDAFAQMVGHSHAFRWTAGGSGLARHLTQCKELLQSVPVFRLGRTSSLASLGDLAARIERLVSAETPQEGGARPMTARCA